MTRAAKSYLTRVWVGAFAWIVIMFAIAAAVAAG
jgi:hypothetical protein